MNNVEEFRKFLKRRGKKDHVVDSMIDFCKCYESFLTEHKKNNLDDATEKDLLDFIDHAEKNNEKIKHYLRGISLYYLFIKKLNLSKLASTHREKKISKTRKSFKLTDFRGVNHNYIDVLKSEGIVTVDQLLEKGKTPSEREQLSHKTGIPLTAITEYVKLSDLSRLGAVKSVRARLYYDASLDTIDKVANWDPEELRKMLIDFIDKTGFDGIAPLPKEVKNLIEAAKKIKRTVVY